MCASSSVSASIRLHTAQSYSHTANHTEHTVQYAPYAYGSMIFLRFHTVFEDPNHNHNRNHNHNHNHNHDHNDNDNNNNHNNQNDIDNNELQSGIEAEHASTRIQHRETRGTFRMVNLRQRKQVRNNNPQSANNQRPTAHTQ
jgi:hypothetical protein